MLASSDSRDVANGNSSSSSSSWKQCRRSLQPQRHLSRYPGERVAKKYQQAAIRRAEFRKLKAIVPAVAGKKSVTKLAVVEEAIRYIDELHARLAQKIYGSDTPYLMSDGDEFFATRCHLPFVDITSPSSVFLSRLSPAVQREARHMTSFDQTMTSRVVSTDDPARQFTNSRC